MGDEAIDILKGLWRGKPFSYHGQHFQVNKVLFLPKPVQAAGVPSWAGGG